MGAIRDITPEREATGEELRQYDMARDRIQQLDKTDTFNANDPNQRLFYLLK